MSETKKKKKKFPWKPVLMIPVFIIIGFCAGLGIGTLMDSYIEELPLEDFLLGLLGVYVFLFLFSFMQTVIHEAGHLVFGLLTGYKFSSFRIGSFMWVKLDGKMQLKRFSLAGTGGQCLMAPPDMVDGKLPYVLYNLGGCLANFIVSVIPMVPTLMFWEVTYWHFIVILWVVIGMFNVFMNGIPMKIQGFPNDGHNAMSLGKSPEALKAFWIQMKMNEQIASGKRMRDLPEEWFKLPSEEGMKNSFIASTAVFASSRLMDCGRYGEAQELMERLVTEENGILGIHRQSLKAEIMYCEMIGENRTEKLEEFYDDELKKFFKAMKKNPSKFRVEYLYAKYIEKDEKKAQIAMKMFEKIAKTYPYPNDIVSERELIAYAEEKLAKE